MSTEPLHLFLDRHGQPIDVLEWGRQFEDSEGRTLARTRIDAHRHVVTIWDGVPEPVYSNCVFGTALLVDGRMSGRFEEGRWPTEDAALAGHEQYVAMVRDHLG